MCLIADLLPCSTLHPSQVYETDTGEIKEVHAALRRSRQLRCTECGLMGATVGCCHRSCKGNFHFACARKRDAVFTRKSEVFCQTCVPKVSGLGVAERTDTLEHTQTGPEQHGSHGRTHRWRCSTSTRSRFFVYRINISCKGESIRIDIVVSS